METEEIPIDVLLNSIHSCYAQISSIHNAPDYMKRLKAGTICGAGAADHLYLSEILWSIRFRAQSAHWHYETLAHMHINAVENISRFNLTDNERFDFQMSHVHKVYFLFDDIIFNLVSLFDYIGNFLAILANGQKGKKMKWSGIVKQNRGTSLEHFTEEMCSLLDETDRTFLSWLADYRAYIFHYESKSGGIAVNIDQNTGYSLPISAPEKLKRLFKSFSIEHSDCEILSYAELIKKEAFIRINRIFTQIHQDILNSDLIE